MLYSSETFPDCSGVIFLNVMELLIERYRENLPELIVAVLVVWM
jgi:hypothetical protein